jgi:PAS domain S-box-containing protein
MRLTKSNIWIFGATLAAAIMAVAAISFYVQYESAYSQQREWIWRSLLKDSAMIREMYRSNLSIMHRERAFDATIGQVAFAQSTLSDAAPKASIGIREEATGGTRFLVVNGRLVRDTELELSSLAFGNGLASPMALALAGEQGVTEVSGQGETAVLAAYKPLRLNGDILLGMVVKVDLHTIRAPLLEGGVIALATGFGIALFCMMVLIRAWEPILDSLRQSRDSYRHLVESSGSVIMRLSPDGLIRFLNQYGAALFGPNENKRNQEVFGFVFPEDSKNREAFASAVRQLASSSASVSLDMQCPTCKGHPAWFAWTFSPLTDENDRLTEVLAVGNDITATKRAEDARRESETRFRSIAAASPVGILITDLHGNPAYANEQFLNMFGTTLIQLLSEGWMKMVHPADRKRVRSDWLGGTSRKRSSRSEFRIISRGGRQFWVLGMAVPMGEDPDKPVGIVGTFTDITAIKEAEARSRRLAKALDQAAEVVIITDADGVIEYTNPAFEKVTGYTRKDVVGKKPSILKSGEHDREFYREFWETISSGHVWNGQFRNRRKDGSFYSQECTVGPVKDEDGQIVNYVAVARDITERVENEAQIRHSQKLESIGQLAAGIAHEINTPIQYVGDNLRFLEEAFGQIKTVLDTAMEQVEQLPGEEAEKARQTITKIADEADVEFMYEEVPQALEQSRQGIARVTEIVRSMKEFSHPGEEGMKPSDLNEGIRNTINVARNEWKYVADLETDLDESLPTVHCQISELNQVLLNMIINSAHAIADKIGDSEEKGRITIRTRREDNWVVLEVEDTGIGMTEEVRQRVFDPFFTTKDVGRGTGQGLSIAHNVVVTGHGGKFNVRSTPGEGSTFEIRLPLTPEDAGE